MLLKRALLIFPLGFLVVAFAGLFANPSDFYFPYSFWEEGFKTLKRFSRVWLFLAVLFAFRKSPFVQGLMDRLSGLDRTKFLLFVLPSALLLRIAWCFLTDYQPTGDAQWFMGTAESIFKGKGLSLEPEGPTAVASPGYPYFLAFLYTLFGKNVLGIQLVQCLMDVTNLFFIFILAEKIFGKAVAFLTTLYLSFSVNQILVAPLVINEHLYVLVVSLALYLLVSDLGRESWRKLLTAGLLLGISNLTRGVLLIFPPFLFFLYLFSRFGVKKSFLKAGLVTFISIVTVLPWTYRNYKVLGYPVPICTSAGYGFYSMNNPIADPYVTHLVKMRTVHPEYVKLHPNQEVASYLGGSRYAREWILTDPWRFIRLGAGKLISLFGARSYWTLYDNVLKYGESRKGYVIEAIFKKPMLYGYMLHFTLFFIAIFILLFRYGWTHFDSRKMLVLLLIYVLVGVHFLFAGEKRYRYPIDPFIYMTSAFMLVYIVRKDLVSDGLSPTIP